MRRRRTWRWIFRLYIYYILPMKTTEPGLRYQAMKRNTEYEEQRGCGPERQPNNLPNQSGCDPTSSSFSSSSSHHRHFFHFSLMVLRALLVRQHNP